MKRLSSDNSEPVGEIFPSTSVFDGYLNYAIRNYHPNWFMRRLGYTRNPDICRHERKQYYNGRWTCQDCGDDVAVRFKLGFTCQDICDANEKDKESKTTDTQTNSLQG